MYLKEFREYLGLSQKEFGDCLGVTQVTITRYETNKIKPSVSIIEKCINIFNANPNFIFLGINPKILDIEDNNISYKSSETLKDFNLIVSHQELSHKLNNLLVGEITNRLGALKNGSVLIKILNIINLINSLSVRPFLFIYNMLRFIDEDKDNQVNIKSHVVYISDLICKHRDLKSEKEIQNIKIMSSINLEENECKELISGANSLIKHIESRTSSFLMPVHKKIKASSIFQK